MLQVELNSESRLAMEVFNPEKHVCSLLYVEDDPEARDLVNRALSLKFRNIRLLTAENGAVGLELYQKHRPEIVLTDIKMPVMDGIMMAAQIRGQQPDAVIAVISAYCDTQQYQANAVALGITHCVSKPVAFSKLFATIEKCLSEVIDRRAMNHWRFLVMGLKSVAPVFHFTDEGSAGLLLLL
jgi:YesN/AraC family two-component response regulator